MNKRLVILLSFVSVIMMVAFVVGGGIKTLHTTSADLADGAIPYLDITTAADTAQVMRFRLNSATASAADSFTYLDTFVVGALPDTFLATYVSPSQVMIFTLAGNTGDLLMLDTVGIGVVGCTVSFAAQELGIEYDLSTGADSTIATAYDSIVDLINKRTNLKDSVLASDSGTYIKIASKHSQDVFTARWSILMTTDSTDTAGNYCTQAEVTAGMVAAINAEDSISAFATAAASGDTAWTVTSDDPGLAFLCYIGDTATDTTHTTLNVTSYSRSDDTIFLFSTLSEENPVTGMAGYIILDTASTMTQGVGGLDGDSAYLILYGGMYVKGNLVLEEIFRDSIKTLPCTMIVKEPALAKNDTLFLEGIWLEYIIEDSASDSTFSVPCVLNVDLLLFTD